MSQSTSRASLRMQQHQGPALRCSFAWSWAMLVLGLASAQAQTLRMTENVSVVDGTLPTLTAHEFNETATQTTNARRALQRLPSNPCLYSGATI